MPLGSTGPTPIGSVKPSSGSRTFPGIVLVWLDHVLDRIYRSKYNPLYQSGSLAVALFAILTATGIYLLLFYRVGSPWASVAALQDQWYLGKWIRAVHRYATDLLVLIVVYHVLHMMMQGRTWGPRVLAWISGFILLGLILFSAWTGYVMVWDDHGVLLARSGSKLLSVFGFLKNYLNEAFDGSHPVNGIFFFINLFAHVGLPLTLFFFIWIHTSRLARARWFPERKLLWGLAVALSLAGILWPAALGAEGNLFRHGGATLIDWITSGWIPFSMKIDSRVFLAAGGAFSLLFLSIPWWWPKRRKRETAPATVAVDRCGGCRQCEKDCPFEAVVILEGPGGKGKLSSVDPDLCTSCGLCAGSCTEYAIGPPGRTAVEQIGLAKEDLAHSQDSDRTLVLYCANNPGVKTFLSKKQKEKNFQLREVDCTGSLHPEILRLYLERHAEVLLWSCPSHNCENREGFDLAEARSFERRLPSAALHFERNKLRVFQGSSVEGKDFLNTEPLSPESPRRFKKILSGMAALLFTLLVFFGVSQLSSGRQGNPETMSAIRLSLRLSSPVVETRTTWTAEELKKVPPHMRLSERVERLHLPGTVSLSVDGIPRFQNHSAGGKKEDFTFVSEIFELAPGPHLLDLRIAFGVPEKSAAHYSNTLVFQAGNAWVLGFNGNEITAKK